MTECTPWSDGFFHPASEAELSLLIIQANAKNLAVRVRGSAHSELRAIYSDARLNGSPEAGMDIMLDQMSGFVIDRERRQVTVSAGCRFGFDPRDPTGQSTEANGLCPALEAVGLALPLLGGVSHQTVAGFLSTGSDGGSIEHSLGEQVAALTLVDGRGEVHHLTRGTDEFAAAGVSFGTFGIISSVTFDCVDRFDVVGEERSSRLAKAEFDLFSEGEDGLAAFLTRVPYARVLWWPQPGVNKLVVWKGRAAKASSPPRPYNAFPKIAGSRLPMQAAAGLALRTLNRPIRWMQRAPRILRRVAETILRLAYDIFVPAGEVQEFSDVWHHAIPLDDQMEERLMPVRFTEIWVAVDDAAEFMRRLKDLFARLGYRGSGNFVFEIYGGKKSDFWMSPGYGRNSVRLNIFWLEHNPGEPENDFFPLFWDLARDLGSRLHWGKVLDPRDQDHYKRFPKHQDFLEMRAQFDPHGRFLTDYWRHHLGLGLGLEARPLVPLRAAPSVPRRPMFAMRPTDRDYPAKARARFVVSFRTKASPLAAFEAFRVDHTDWVSDLRGYRPLTGPITGVGRVVDEALLFMTVRIRVVAEEPGQYWIAAVDASSLPLAERMLEEVLFEAVEGGTQVTWNVCYDPLPQIALFEPLVRPLFRALFQRMANAFKKHLDTEAGR